MPTETVTFKYFGRNIERMKYTGMPRSIKLTLFDEGEQIYLGKTSDGRFVEMVLDAESVFLTKGRLIKYIQEHYFEEEKDQVKKEAEEIL